ncbi:LOW QUALITY PROTEIN: protein DMP2 [Quercus suber]|uniref:LOW QUALITY PROTEIN: protein DMP2 n=1 Tax=Quercus suber TaxID=58331 RepID=UPI0032DF7E63
MGASKSKQFSQSSQTTIKDKTLSGLGNLNRLLPTGTVFLYQFLSPVLSNKGHCTITIYKYLTAILVAVCGFSCFFSSFTDSYVGDDGKTHYGVVTSKGLWTSEDSKNVDLSVYKLRFGDFVHGLFALAVFGVLVLLDQKTVGCFYPLSDSSEKTLLKVLPPVVGVVSSALFMFFPNKRHGIGYPSSSTDSSQVSKSGGSEVSLTKA